MNEPRKEDDEKRFNETLKRMLKTPPKPHKEKRKLERDTQNDAKKNKTRDS